MSWKDVLKGSCGSHREKADDEKEGQYDFEKKLVGDQHKIARVAPPKDKITAEDFKGLRDGAKKADKTDSQVEKEILAMFKKEGGALGMKNLKDIAPSSTLDKILDDLMSRKIVGKHRDGDLIDLRGL